MENITSLYRYYVTCDYENMMTHKGVVKATSIKEARRKVRHEFDGMAYKFIFVMMLAPLADVIIE